MKKNKIPKQRKFEIKTFFDETDLRQKTCIYIDDDMIYEVDKTIYNGMTTRDNSKDIKAAISKKLKREITDEQITRAKWLKLI